MAGLGHAAQEVGVKLVRVEGKKQNHTKRQERNQFADGTNEVQNSGLLYAAQDDKVKTPNQHRTTHNGKQIVSSGKVRREEIVKCVHGDDRIAHVAENLAQPISPADGKAHIRAESFACVHIDAGS